MGFISYSKYKNKDSIVLENEELKVMFIPNPGGKMVSFISKKTGYEFLVQREGSVYRDQPYGGVFVDGECSGFDDMFPTIDECKYDKEPWKDLVIPDHGEVWSLPWHPDINSDFLSLSVNGIKFPYNLEKVIKFSGHNTLRIDYTLTNNGLIDFDFLWAAHAMINIEEGTRILVPDNCKQTFTILSYSKRMGEYGDIKNWPVFEDNMGVCHRADISRRKDVTDSEKYYFTNKLNTGYCELLYLDNTKFRIEFPPETVPYLGVLLNENGWDNRYNIFIEPCTVCFDRPDKARFNGQISTVKALSQYRWYVEMIIDQSNKL